MEVSMFRLTWLTVAQHVFQLALTGRLELISRKIVSREPGTKAIAVSRFREKLSPANWVQGVTAISRKISRSWAPKNGVQHATAIYPIPRYTRPRYIGLTLYYEMDYSFYSFYWLDSLEIWLDHNSTYYRSLSKNSDVKPRISHCDSQNLQYKTHPEFWPSHRQIFKTSLYYKTHLILETRR